jgi:hypothetical protein
MRVLRGYSAVLGSVLKLPALLGELHLFFFCLLLALLLLCGKALIFLRTLRFQLCGVVEAGRAGSHIREQLGEVGHDVLLLIGACGWSSTMRIHLRHRQGNDSKASEGYRFCDSIMHSINALPH